MTPKNIDSNCLPTRHPTCRRQIRRRTSGIEHQDVRLLQRAAQTVDRRGIGEVADTRSDRAASRRNFAGELIQTLEVARDRHHLGAFRRQSQSDCAAESARGTGHQCVSFRKS
jgi:hypothetical protein